MLKLYKKEPDGSLSYAEYWIDRDEVVLHFGKVGELGEKEVKSLNSESEYREEFMKLYTSKGYDEVLEQDYYWVIIQYPIKEKFGNKKDFELIDKVSAVLNEELGWKGLGEVDGNDIGLTSNPTKEQFALNIFCIVVDEQQGISVIQKILKKKRLEYKGMKIASRRNTDDSEYKLKYSTKKGDFEFYE